MASANYVAQSGQFYSGTIPGKGGNAFRGIGTGIANMVTGDLDYARELETLGYQNAFNASEAQKQRDWEERLANSAYQRAVADMSKAGLNPYLAYSQGGSATPSGSAASSGTGVALRSGQQFAQLLGNVIGLLSNLAATGVRSATQVATTKSINANRIAVADIQRDTARLNALYRAKRR